MIKAELQGRRLVLTVETDPDETAIEPFVIDPVPAKIGRELGARYLLTLEGIPIEDGSISDDMRKIVGEANYLRLDEEVSQAEGEKIMQAAYFWNLITGMDGVRVLLDDDGRGDGLGKAIALFRSRMEPLLSQIRLRLESELRTSAASIPGTDSPAGGVKPGKQPRDRQKPKPKAKNPAESSPPPTASE